MKKVILLLTIVVILILTFFFMLYNNNNNSIVISDDSKISSNLYTFNNLHLAINYDEFTFYNKTYYKEIYNYEDYFNYTQFKPDILKMEKDDFNNKFMIIIATENTSMKYLTLSKIYKENDILYIGLDRVSNNENFYEYNNALSIIINNSLKSSSIIIYKTINDSNNFSTKYKKITELPKDYSEEQAITDNCLVNGEINTDIFYTFLENVNNHISDGIRIYNSQEGIMDLTYLPNKAIYIVCVRKISENSELTYNYYEYNKLNLKYPKGINTENGINRLYDTYILSNTQKEEPECSISIK